MIWCPDCRQFVPDPTGEHTAKHAKLLDAGLRWICADCLSVRGRYPEVEKETTP